MEYETLRSAKRYQRGFTVVEVSIASVIMVAMLGAVISVLNAGQRSIGTGMTRTRLNGKAREVVERIAKELRNARIEPFADAATSAHSVDFRRRYGNYADGFDDFDLTIDSVRWSELPLESFRCDRVAGEIENGLDDNGNGVADECELVRVSGGAPMVICRDVAPDGFTVRFESARKLDISLTLRSRDDRRDVLTSSASTLVFLRN